MTKTKKSTTPPVKLPDGKIRRAIIGALLVDPKSCNWAIEMRMINCLLKKHNDPDFWFFLSRRMKFISLRNLIAQQHIIFSIHLEYMKQKSLNLLPPSPIIELSKEKVGEDAVLPPKPPTLLDFIQK